MAFNLTKNNELVGCRRLAIAFLEGSD